MSQKQTMIFTWQKQPPKLFIEISQNSQENTCTRVSFLIKLQAWGLAQVFCCEFCEISKNTFFKQLWVTASDLSKKNYQQWMFGMMLSGFWAKMETLARNGLKLKKCQIFLVPLFSRFVKMDWFQEFRAFRDSKNLKHERYSVLWKLLTATNC